MTDTKIRHTKTAITCLEKTKKASSFLVITCFMHENRVSADDLILILVPRILFFSARAV